MSLSLSPPPNSRFSLLFPYLWIFLAVSLLTRSLLLIHQQADLSLSPGQLAAIYGIGLVYDLGFFSYLAIPFVLLLLFLPERVLHSRLFRLGTYLATAGFCFFLLFVATAEWLFWEEFGVRFNFIAVDYLIYRREVTGNILESYPLFRLVGGMLMVSMLGLLLLRPAIERRLAARDRFQPRLVRALTLLLIPVLAGAGLGQSLHEYSNNRFNNELAANGPYQFVAAFRNNTIDYRQLYRIGDDRELSARLRELLTEDNSRYVNDDLFDITRDIRGRSGEQDLNVVLITVESLSAGFLGQFGCTLNVTPALDRLARESLVFDNLYATGTRTVRGLEAVTLSLPPTPGRSVVKRPDNARMFNLGKVFKDHGYDPVFFYGGYGYFDNMNDFYSGNGYRVIDRTDLGVGEVTFENAWGVADGDLLSRVLREGDRDAAAGRHFFFQIMTTSNHRPYTYPEGKVSIPSGTGRLGAIAYTDFALGRFLEEARSHPWFKDTVFVILADHCAGSAGKEALPVENYHIPLFIYSPAHVAPAVNHTLASQIDVAPTVLGLLNFSYRSQFFGHDLLGSQREGQALIGNYQRLGLLRDGQLAYLSPRRELTVIDQPLGKNLPIPEDRAFNLPIARDVMAYYQGADYLLGHRLNRW